MTRRAWLWFAFGVTVVLLTLVLAWADRVRGEDLAGAVEIQIPEARQWWAQTALCLGDPAPYPAHVRFYVGTTIPSSWVANVDEGKTFAGYTDPMHGRVMLTASGVRDSGLVTHEIFHVIHGSGHPASVFSPPRCGLARP